MRQSLDFIRYMDLLENAFDIDGIIQQDFTLQDIEKYYLQSNLGYLLVHSPQGAVHMALSKSDKFTRKDYMQQVNYVSEEIEELQPDNVLELGTGKGFNLYHLASRLPHIEFVGIDLSQLHVKQSGQKLRHLSNVNVFRADFHDIPFSAESFDYVFEFESICHALDTTQVLKSIHNILRPSGFLTLFDGFRVLPTEVLSEREKRARYLVEKPMGVQEGILVKDFLELADDAGFDLVSCEDLSTNIMPNLNHIQSIQIYIGIS